MPPRIAFSTLGCPDWTWFDLLRYGPKFGYDGVEIRLLAREVDLLQVPDLQPVNLARRRRELDDAGFAVCALASSVRFDFAEQRQVDEQINIGCAYVDLAHALGAKFVRVFGDVLPHGAAGAQRHAALARIAEGLDRLGEHAAQASVEVLLETHGDFFASPNVRDLMQLCRCPSVGVLWDTHHPWRFCGETFADTSREIGKWVRHAHWKDSVSRDDHEASAESEAAAREAEALMSGHRHADYVLFGSGQFPARDCLKSLLSTGYDGWHCLEWEKMWHPELAGPETAFPPFPQQFRSLYASVTAELAGSRQPSN